MRDYVKLLDWLRSSQNACYIYGCDECPADCENHEGDIFKDAADAIEELLGQHEADEKEIEWLKKCVQDLPKPPRWISVENPPKDDRNIFICYGQPDFKAPCIGHYDPVMKRFYEDRNWFASPIYDAMFWCEMPELPLPEPPKEVLPNGEV